MSEVENIEYMFYGCINLRKIIGIENWDLSKVKKYEGMFKGMDYYVKKYYSNKILNKVDSVYDIKQIKIPLGITKSLSINVSENWDITSNDTMDNIIKSLLNNNINNFTLKVNDDNSVTVNMNTEEK